MTSQVSGQWASGDTEARILEALHKTGLSPEQLSIDDLAPVDHIHALGFRATKEMAQALELQPGDRLLDVGSGLGGPARYMAQRFRCHVSGVDITPEWVALAQKLSEYTGFQDRVDFTVGDATALPYPDSSFNGAICQHVTMNIADRSQLFSEIYRVLKPGAFLAMSEQGLGVNGLPKFPVPWSEDGTGSHLLTAAETRGYLVSSGFRLSWLKTSAEEDIAGYTRMAALLATDQMPHLGTHLVLGDNVLQKIQNAAQNIRDGHIEPFLLLAHKPH